MAAKENGNGGPRATTPEQASQHPHHFKCLLVKPLSVVFFISYPVLMFAHYRYNILPRVCLVGVAFMWTWSLSELEQNLVVFVRVKVFFLIIY
jgi:hypothetical protein